MGRRQRGEGSVFQRASDGRWVGQVDLGWAGGKRRRKTVTATTQKAAVAKLREVRRSVEGGDLNTAGTSVETWLRYWLTDVCPGKPRMKPKTLRTYRSYVEAYLIPSLGRVRLDRLNAQHVRGLHRYVDSLGLSSTTARHAHVILGTALNDAVRDRRITANIAALVPAPSKAPSRTGSLSLTELAALMHHLDGDRLQSRWAFALFTGARQGECLGLTWDHLNLDAGTVDLAWQLQRIPYRHGCTISCGRKPDRCPDRSLSVPRGFDYRVLDGNLCLQRPKTKGSTRVLPLPGPLVVALTERRDLYVAERSVYATDHGLVWCRVDGRPIDGRVDWAQWSSHLAAVGIGHQPLHIARHTASTLMQAIGVPEDVRMAILGHSEAATTRLYSHVDLTLQRAAMDRFGDAVTAALDV